MTSFVKEVPRKVVSQIVMLMVSRVEKIVYREKISLTHPSLDQRVKSGSLMEGRGYSIKKSALAREFLRSKELNEKLQQKKSKW